MQFDPQNFAPVKYGPAQLHFDKASPFREHFGHRLRTRRFPYYQNCVQFVSSNPDAKIYFTLNDAVQTFRREGDCLLVNLSAYQKFCSEIGTKTGGRFKAFIGQNLDLKQVEASPEEKASFIRANATQADIINVIQNLPESGQQEILNSLASIKPAEGGVAASEVSAEELISALARFLKDKELQRAFYENLPKVQLDTLKSHVAFLRANLDKNESFIQNWIDEDDGKYRKQRCLIFGLEYVDPVREGQVAGKRFDVLAEQDLNHHVIFELKSPKDEIFQVKEEPVSAGGTTTEYHLSKQLSRAIPEVLGYRKFYENCQAEELQKLGIKQKKEVSKCVIVLGTRRDDDVVWCDNFNRIRSTLNGIELLTYSDLIDRLDNTIRNLEEHTSPIAGGDVATSTAIAS
jgi:hypothetical protein